MQTLDATLKLPTSGTVLLVAAALALTPVASLQAEEGRARPQGIEEVVVTAQRRTESLQSVPMAISAFSEETLRTRGIEGLADLETRTPGLAIGQFFPVQPQVYIRGIGSNDDGPASDPSTVLFVDEVYVGRVAGWTGNLFDLERIEVLRGPQGTLYGKNVVGGAINFISRKPTEEFRTQFSATTGNLDLVKYSGLVSGQLAENVYGKLSFVSESRDGYLKTQIGNYPQFFPQYTLPDNAGKFQQHDVNTDAYRAALRLTPNERLEINLSADRAKLDQNSPGFHERGGAAGRVLAGLIPDYDKRIRTNMAEQPAGVESQTTGYMARIDYDLDFATVTSISAYRESDSLNTNHPIGEQASERKLNLLATSPTAVAGLQIVAGSGNIMVEGADQFTQELRLTSNGSGALEWVGGLYYLQEQVDRTESFNVGIAVLNDAGGWAYPAPAFAPSTGQTPQEAETKSAAVYGQATWNVTEQLRLTAGARYTEDRKDIHTIGVPGGFVVQQPFDVRADDKWSQMTPKFAVDYQLTDDVFLYALASKGFKSGGWQGTPGRAKLAAEPFNEETAWLYESGARTDFWDDRARVNLSVFFTDYKDLQVFQQLIPVGSPRGTLVGQNAADAEVKGAELEATFVPLPGLTFSGFYAYLDATYTSFIAPEGYLAPGGVDIGSRKGNYLRNSPKQSWALLTTYDMTLAGGAGLSFQLDWQYKDKVYQDPDNLEIGATPSYDVLDGRVALTSRDERWEMALWAKNLLGEDYFIHSYASGTPASGIMTPGLPLTYGVTLTWMGN
jgi:iron complex outermembrane recepter protein